MTIKQTGGIFGRSPTFTNVNVDGTITADTYDLDAIAASKADTAVDVFVYDTSKDSDGGAWRKRTQATSWYNETLNTATRGSRREFPAVAVIVAEAAKVTIYDGDDPALPMWMVFNGGNTAIGSPAYALAINSAFPATSVTGKNGIICVGGYYVHRLNFVSEVQNLWGVQGFYRAIPISERNTLSTWVLNEAQLGRIVSVTINDVAMTVLPNAPIDPATGLPVPTIAVATAGGVSVIRDDGTVVDSSSSIWASSVSFDGQNNLLSGRITAATNVVGIASSSTYTSDGFDAAADGSFSPTTTPALISASASPSVGKAIAVNYGLVNYKTSGGGGIGILNLNDETPSNSMVAYTTSTYNTGWMNGDIKGAFLSNTDDTDLVGSGELVTNGTFDTDTSGWSATNNSVLSVDTNRLKVTNNVTDYGSAYQDITTVAGGTYVVTLDFELGTSSRGRLSILVAGGATIFAENYTADGSYNATFVAPTASTRIQLINNETADASHCLFDNISVKLADADRSVNAQGLVVNGTVTRTPVATGADLVAYSGFSGSNYLEQPYNSDLDFGTGDFCIMGWQKGTDSIGPFLTRNSNNANHLFAVGSYDTDKVWFSTGDSSGNKTAIQTDITTPSIDADVWNCWCFVRRNGVLEVWLGGVLQGTKSGTVRDVSSTDAVLYVATDGPSASYGGEYTGSLALWRISATAPTAEQIAKIYNDEKVLFQEGAQATLFGASDAVTALAHDSDTGLLHVGTSAGRSVFQGLRRVSNTTTAVGTAISAANNLVVEE